MIHSYGYNSSGVLNASNIGNPEPACRLGRGGDTGDDHGKLGGSVVGMAGGSKWLPVVGASDGMSSNAIASKFKARNGSSNSSSRTGASVRTRRLVTVGFGFGLGFGVGCLMG